MENKIYYGEYSLAYWLELIIHKKIELPDYQRYYVWNRKDMESLVETFTAARFVPPVTIGSYVDNGAKRNLIIDGQQRLTSILLAALGYFPKFSEWKDPEPALASDDFLEDNENAAYVIEWTFKKLLKERCFTLGDIRNALEEDRYEKLNTVLTDEFLKNKYMGFSYIVPQGASASDPRSFYARVFRDLNSHGRPLNVLDSRRSLYFLDPGMDQFFEPEFVKRFSIVDPTTKKVKQRLDFVRYLSMIDEYHKKSKNVNLIVKRFKSDPEQYFAEYIANTRDGNDDTRFRPLTASFPSGDCIQRIQKLEKTVGAMGLPNQYPSIIDADLAFFGVVSVVLYEGKSLDVARKDEFQSELKVLVESDKAYQSKSPSHLANLRNRISQSVALYNRFTVSR